MWITRRSRLSYVLLGLLIIGLAVLVAACGGSSATTTSATVTPTTSGGSTTTSGGSSTTSGGSSTSGPAFTGDQATIAANFAKFFDGTQPAADKAALLENGAQYQKEIDAQAASPMGKLASVSVSAVTITSPTTADVTYSILVGGTPALPNQPGKAVLQDGVWKVSADSFLALLALQAGSAPTTAPAP